MHVLVTGAAGFIGTHLLAELLARGSLLDADGRARPIERLVAIDIAPARPSRVLPGSDPRIERVVADAGSPEVLARLFSTPVDAVFALGATLTAEAEARYEHGMAVNLHGTMALLDACRRQSGVPRFVFASSIAAFGGPLPACVDDTQALNPQTSYGTQKAINELLINDLSRRGEVDGRCLRLPIVLCRPAGSAASISDRVAAIVREPLSGRDTVCGLRPDTRVPLASARAVARALLATHDVPAARFGATRSMNLPSLSLRLDEMADAVRAWAHRHAHPTTPGTVRWTPDAALQAIVDAWPRRFDSDLARSLGITGDNVFDEVIGHFVADHGQAAEAAA